MLTLMHVPIPQPIEEIAARLKRLPGVGEKTALKYALFLASYADVADLGESLLSLPLVVRPCLTCRALTDAAGCPYCSRPSGIVCVVHRYVDLLAIERAQAVLKMRYFVLDKLLSPLEGIHAEDLPMAALQALVAGSTEVVLALPPSVDGEATSMLLRRSLAHPNVTHPARGLPHGGDLENADQVTLHGAFNERTLIKERT